MKKTIKIEGMGCMMCVKKVTAALEALEGVSGVEVSLEEKQAVVTLSAPVADDALAGAVTAVDFDVVSVQ